MKVLKPIGILIFPTIVATVGFFYAAYAYLMIGWAWSDSFPPGWTTSQLVLNVMLWAIPFLFSLWLVYRLTGCSLKYTTFAEVLSALLAFSLLGVWAHRGRGPRILLEKNAPVLQTTNLIDTPSLPLAFEAVGVEAADGSFNPIMFLTPPFGRMGYKTPLLTYNLKAGPPQIAVYRGTNDVAATNHFLGRFQISGYAKTKQSLQLMVVFQIDDKHQLFLQVRDVDSSHNTPLKIKRLKTMGKK